MAWKLFPSLGTEEGHGAQAGVGHSEWGRRALLELWCPGEPEKGWINSCPTPADSTSWSVTLLDKGVDEIDAAIRDHNR